MTKLLTIAALLVAVGGPSLAESPATERLAAKLELNPEQYSLAELTRISQVTGAERKRVITIINRQHADFEYRVHKAMQTGSDPLSVEVSRNAQ